MLEALVCKKTGEIIVVAPAGKAWSDFERDYFSIVQWTDPELGEVKDVMCEPYHVYDDKGKKLGVTKNIRGPVDAKH